MKKKIAVLQGGMSAEREVSLNTAKAFVKALDELGHEYVVIDAKEDLPVQLAKYKPDVVLNALHGKYAEDGTVQGICEYMKIPYSGSGVLASALTMDKIRTKQVLMHDGFPTADFQVLDYRIKNYQPSDIKMALPFVVKPSREGSSVGISICKSADEVGKALEYAKKHDYRVLVEKFIKGTEITVPILGGKALTPIEIVPNEHFYDYEHKYTKGKTQYLLPPNKSPELIKKVQELTEKIFVALDLRSYARMDFLIDDKDQPYLLEVNPLPGCTETSLVPKSAAHDGIVFKDFIQRLIDTAALDYEGLS
jgi:D-alanine-D-alanine ligase